MKKHYQSLALIPDTGERRSRWFCHWDFKESSYDFVTAERAKDESGRESIEREVADKLGLKPRDLLVANMAQLNLEFKAITSPDEAPHYFSVAFYLVNLYGRRARQTAEGHPDGRWLSAKELLEGQTQDGRIVSPWLTRLLRMSEVIQPW